MPIEAKTYTNPRDYNELIKKLKGLMLRIKISKNENVKRGLTKQASDLIKKIEVAKQNLPPNTKFKVKNNKGQIASSGR